MVESEIPIAADELRALSLGCLLVETNKLLLSTILYWKYLVENAEAPLKLRAYLIET